MSKITNKLAHKIATVMAGDLFTIRIQYANEQLSEALAKVAKQTFPPEVFEFIRQYPQFAFTTEKIGVKGNIGGECVYISGPINFSIPQKPIWIEVDDKTISSLQDIHNRREELCVRRERIKEDIADRIFDCKTFARLKQEFPEAYSVLLSILSDEKENK